MHAVGVPMTLPAPFRREIDRRGPIRKMNLDYIPLLRVQRELHGIPRGRERFRQYLRTISNQDGTDIELVPLLIMNPMGKDHVTALLDGLLALDADGVPARPAAGASAPLAHVPGDFTTAPPADGRPRGG